MVLVVVLCSDYAVDQFYLAIAKHSHPEVKTRH